MKKKEPGHAKRVRTEIRFVSRNNAPVLSETIAFALPRVSIEEKPFKAWVKYVKPIEALGSLRARTVG